MKSIRNSYIILILIIPLAIMECQDHPSGIVGTKWSSLNQTLARSDSLVFLSDSAVIWYCCETSWHYDGVYHQNGNLLTMYIVLDQFEVADISGLKPNMKMVFSVKESELKVSYLGRGRPKFTEIDEESYSTFGSYVKVKY